MVEITSIERRFLPPDFKPTSWEVIKPFADDLTGRTFETLADYKKFLRDCSELYSVITDEGSWRYVLMSRDTADEKRKKDFEFYIQTIDPPFAELDDKINHMIAGSPFAGQVQEEGFGLMLKKIQNQMALFREENIPLGVEISTLSNDVNALRGAMTVMLDGKEQTLMEAEDALFLADRAKRETAWKAMRDRLVQDKGKLDEAFTKMFDLRTQIAKNAGFKNFRDYKFASLNRFDYTPQDCANFHHGVREHILPIMKRMYQVRKSQLKLDKLCAWDLDIDPFDRQPVKAFDGETDLIDKSIAMLDAVDADFGQVLKIMKQQDRFDLMSRPGKQPGGYMMPLYEHSIPFICTNFTAKNQDIVTMAHEAGHAIHEVMMHKLPLLSYRSYPSEVAELGSMTMELLSAEHWDVFYEDKQALYRARREHLEDIITMIPWMAIVDEFQHGIYTMENPGVEARHELWDRLVASYSTGEVDADGYYPHPTRVHWHKQGHIFESPFYYIDYAIAQLGSLQVYRNYKQDPEKALHQFKYALSLGGSRSLPEIYAAAGVQFNFGSEMLNDLMQFVGSEITRLGELEMAAMR